jgi:hypothetical protein
MWALLTLYQAIRTAMVTAVESVPGTDPDRASFTVAMTTAQDLVGNAAGILTDTVDLVGTIGWDILANLLDARRPRVSTRKVKSPLARYAARQPDGRPLTSQNITRLTITVHDPTGNTNPTFDTSPATGTTPSGHPRPRREPKRRPTVLTAARSP